MKVNVSSHGKTRMQERLNVYNTYKSTISNVRIKGKSVEYFHGPLYYYLTRKKKGQIWVYKNNIYVFGTKYNKKKLITVFPVPKRYLPVEKFLIGEATRKKVTVINVNAGKKVIIIMKNGDKIEGISCPNEETPAFSIRLKISDKKAQIIRGAAIKDFLIL